MKMGEQARPDYGQWRTGGFTQGTGGGGVCVLTVFIPSNCTWCIEKMLKKWKKTKESLKEDQWLVCHPTHPIAASLILFSVRGAARAVSVKVFRAPSWSCSLERRREKKDRQIDRTTTYIHAHKKKMKSGLFLACQSAFDTSSNPRGRSSWWLTNALPTGDDVDEPHGHHFLLSAAVVVHESTPFYFCVSCAHPYNWMRMWGYKYTGCHAARCVDCWPSGVSLWFTTLVSVHASPLFLFLLEDVVWANTCRMCVVQYSNISSAQNLACKILKLNNKKRPNAENCWTRLNLSNFGIIFTIYG